MNPVAHLKIVPKTHICIRELALRYGISKSTLYELIRTDPTFPYRNVGLKKRFMIDTEKFESWLNDRTQKQKEENFHLPTAIDLLKRGKE